MSIYSLYVDDSDTGAWGADLTHGSMSDAHGSERLCPSSGQVTSLRGEELKNEIAYARKELAQAEAKLEIALAKRAEAEEAGPPKCDIAHLKWSRAISAPDPIIRDIADIKNRIERMEELNANI